MKPQTSFKPSTTRADKAPSLIKTEHTQRKLVSNQTVKSQQPNVMVSVSGGANIQSMSINFNTTSEEKANKRYLALGEPAE